MEEALPSSRHRGQRRHRTASKGGSSRTSDVGGVVRSDAEKFGLDLTVKAREPKVVQTVKV